MRSDQPVLIWEDLGIEEHVIFLSAVQTAKVKRSEWGQGWPEAKVRGSEWRQGWLEAK